MTLAAVDWVAATRRTRRASQPSSPASPRATPDLPLIVTESGIATEVGTRRAGSVVRILETIDPARRAGVAARSATEGATVQAEIAARSRLTTEQRTRYGGDGPMTPEPGVPDSPAFCTGAALGR